ncbi:MAG: DUF4194 domain-containing protein [bacterium]|nr:DUF4194 domain-containing protein [bacterium]
MTGYYNTLMLEEQEELSDAIQLLQSQTYVLEKKYDKRNSRYHLNKAYRVCEKHLDFIKEYFKIARVDVIENTQYGIIGLKSSVVQGEKFSKLTSVFVLLLKLLFDEKMGEASNSIHIYVTLQEVYEKIQLFHVWENKSISPTDLKRTLAVLKRYQVIEVLDPMAEVTPETKLIIYPTIHMVLNPEDVAAILEQYGTEEEEENE